MYHQQNLGNMRNILILWLVLLFSACTIKEAKLISLKIEESPDLTPNPDILWIKAKIPDIFIKEGKMQIAGFQFFLKTDQLKLQMLLSEYDLTKKEFTFKGYSSQYQDFSSTQLDSISNSLLSRSCLEVTSKMNEHWYICAED